ncbi:transcriptional regulator [Cyanobium sp. Copco_Reservoir_LC18]|uniref:TetR/AcrR family transcriptional regulator n=1 Tax=Cyanobium sp. Copco_Reservoir_LC18 TaxID=1328305 RepID=UPI0016B73A13|nr:TetR/AcrR family transcriptional regulator [Cyanobium sp. Copco_Reservoir_LC18]KAF0654957.1 transcriptional regulator [Cyanobium sp. Copco_Reservoir_LC18]
MPPSVRQLSGEKAAAILAGAMQEFLAQGYAATSMDRVARTAGVSKATVYSHFADKESLFKALTRHMIERDFALLFGGDEAEALPADPRQAMHMLARRMLEVHHTHPEFLAFLRLLIGESDRFPALAQGFMTQIHQKSFLALTELVGACQGPRQGDPTLLAWVFLGSLIHVVMCQDMLHGKEVMPLDREAFATGLVELLCPDPAGSPDSGARSGR